MLPNCSLTSILISFFYRKNELKIVINRRKKFTLAKTKKNKITFYYSKIALKMLKTLFKHLKTPYFIGFFHIFHTVFHNLKKYEIFLKNENKFHFKKNNVSQSVALEKIKMTDKFFELAKR